MDILQDGHHFTKSSVILSFLYDFDLLENNLGFSAYIDLLLNGKRKIGEGRVRVSFNKIDSHQIIEITNTNWTKDKLPLILNSNNHNFIYYPGISLQVSGEDINPDIGKFKVSIFPK